MKIAYEACKKGLTVFELFIEALIKTYKANFGSNKKQ